MKLQIRTASIPLLIAVFTLSGAGAALVGAQTSRPGYGSAGRIDGLTVPENTVISMRMNSSLTSKRARVGDKFTGTVEVPVYVNGETAIPAGATVEGRVTQVTPARRMNRSGSIAIDFDQLIFPDGSAVKLVGTLTSADPYTKRRIDDEGRMSAEDGKNPVIFIGGSGAMGAILGGITGGAKGAAVGGAIGAGAGIASVLLSKGAEAEVPAGTPFGVQLRQPLFVPGSTVASSQSSGRDQDPSYSSGGYNRSDPGTYDPDPVRNRPTYRRRNTDSSKPGVEVPDATREPEHADPAPEARNSENSNNEPPGSDARNNEPVRNDPRDNEPVNTEAAPPPEPEPPLSLSSAEAIRRAQVALKEQGYYEGQADGVMSPRTSSALKVFQREHKLPESGSLDETTARSLGIIGASPTRTTPARRDAGQRSEDSVVPATVLGVSASRLSDGSIYVVIETQANTGGWRWFGEHSVNGNTLEIFAKGVRPTGMVTQAITRGRIEMKVRDGVAAVDRVLVHSVGADRSVSLLNSGQPRASAGSDERVVRRPSIDQSQIASLQRQAEDLYEKYQQLSGIRMTPSGAVDVGRSSSSGEPEIELFFALDSFVKAVQLYGRVVPSLSDRAQLRQATVSMARQARVADRVISTSQSRLASQVNEGWEPVRQAVLSLMRSQQITTAEIEP